MNVDIADHPAMGADASTAVVANTNMMVMKTAASFVVRAAMAVDVHTARPASIGMALAVSVVGVVRIFMAAGASIAPAASTSTND